MRSIAMRTFAFRWAWCVGVVLALGCATTAPPAPETPLERIDRLYRAPLAKAAKAHHATLQLAKLAHDAGRLDEEQWAEVRRVGKEVQAALEEAKALLLNFLDTIDDAAAEAELEEKAGLARADAKRFEVFVEEVVPLSKPVGSDHETDFTGGAW